MSTEPDSEPSKRRGLRHVFGNGNTLKSVSALLALVAALIAIGIIPKLSEIYTRAEAKEHALEERREREKLDARVTATEKAVTKLETIEGLLRERLPAPRKR